MKLRKAKDIYEWDVVNWSRSAPFWLNATQLDLEKSKALEIGARDGGLSVLLGEKCSNVICSDLNGPTEKAHAVHKKYGFENISYEKLSAFDISKKHKDLDLIATKSVLGSFDDAGQSKVISQVHKSLRKGGEYWFVENLKSTPIHKMMREQFTKWGHRWTYIDYKDIEKKFSQFREVEYATFGFSGAFGINAAHRNFMGYMDKAIIDKIVPKSMHYIVAGVARK